MKINFLCLFLFAFLITSCSKEGDDFTEETFTLHENSLIEVIDMDIDNYSIVSGTSTVFSYHFDFNDPLVDDEEFSRMLVFEIGPGVNDFILTDSELRGVNAIISRDCTECFIPPNSYAEEGVIEGSRNSDGTWEIEVDISLPIEINFKERFTN